MTQTTTRPAIGSTATLKEIAGDRYVETEEDAGFEHDPAGVGLMFLPSAEENPIVRALLLAAVGKKLNQGSKALGLTSFDSELVILNITPARLAATVGG